MALWFSRTKLPSPILLLANSPSLAHHPSTMASSCSSWSLEPIVDCSHRGWLSENNLKYYLQKWLIIRGVCGKLFIACPLTFLRRIIKVSNDKDTSPPTSSWNVNSQAWSPSVLGQLRKIRILKHMLITVYYILELEFLTSLSHQVCRNGIECQISNTM